MVRRLGKVLMAMQLCTHGRRLGLGGGGATVKATLGRDRADRCDMCFPAPALCLLLVLPPEAPGGRSMECVLHQGIPSPGAMSGRQGTGEGAPDNLGTGCGIHQGPGRSASLSSFPDEEAAAQGSGIVLPTVSEN